MNLSKLRAAGAALAPLALGVLLCGSASALQFQKLQLVNGWEQYFGPQNASAAVAIDSNNIVHLKGTIYQATGAQSNAFVLPPKYRPDRYVYISANLSGGAFGRLYIATTGVVSVQAPDHYSDAQNFTSLEGITFPKASGPLQFQALQLENNWKSDPGIGGTPSVALDADNVVHLKGVIKHPTGALGEAFLLPLKFRPNKDVYVPVNLAHAKPGRLYIRKGGAVSVDSGGVLADAQAFTSLEGVSYPKN